MKHTQRDETLQVLLATVLKGWPAKKEEVPACIRMYWGYQDEINVQNGVLFKSPRVVVLQSLQAEVMTRTCTSHKGLKQVSRGHVRWFFWPGMTRDQTASKPMCSLQWVQSKATERAPYDLQTTITTMENGGTRSFYLEQEGILSHCRLLQQLLRTRWALLMPPV